MTFERRLAAWSASFGELVVTFALASLLHSTC